MKLHHGTLVAGPEGDGYRLWCVLPLPTDVEGPAESAAGRAHAVGVDRGPGMIRVLLVDDQALLRDGFRSILDREDDIEVVAEAADGAEALAAAVRTSPDVVLMDIRMPRMDGISATRRIVETCGEDVRVLILTTFGNDEYVFEALRAGASGFLLKDAPPEDLLAAIHVIARGDALLDPAVTRAVVSSLAQRASASPGPATPGVPHGA